MKKTITKTLKFISSRLSYLIIGIFIAAAVSFVYATWDGAKTNVAPFQNVGQLSEDNWNELVDALENNIGGGGGFSSCEVIVQPPTTSLSVVTISCSAGKSIRSISHSCGGVGSYGTINIGAGVGKCGITTATATSITGRGENIDMAGGKIEVYFSAAILCCDD